MPETDLNSFAEESALLNTLAYALDHLNLQEGQAVSQATSRRTARRGRLTAMRDIVRERKERLSREKPSLLATAQETYNQRLAALVLQTLDRVKGGFWSR